MKNPNLHIPVAMSSLERNMMIAKEARELYCTIYEAYIKRSDSEYPEVRAHGAHDIATRASDQFYDRYKFQ